METIILTNETFANLSKGKYEFQGVNFEITKVESREGRSKRYIWKESNGTERSGNIAALKDFAGCTYTRAYTPHEGGVAKKIYDAATISERAETLRGKFSAAAATYGSLFEKYGYALSENEKAAFDTLAAAAEKAVTAWQEKALADFERRKADAAAAAAKKQASDAIDALKSDPAKMAKLLELLNAGAL